MDYTDEASAIDDSFFPIDPRKARNQAPKRPPSTTSRYNGPRSGHWTVSTLTHGSGIDDRCPTVHGAPKALQDGESRRLRPIDGSLLRRLAIATEAQKKATADEEKAALKTASSANEPVQQSKVKEQKKDKEFYVPKLEDPRGIRIQSRTGRQEIVKYPTFAPPKPERAISVAKEKEKSKVERKRTPSPPASSRSGGHSSAATNLIRIVGKNGEEAFVKIPYLGRSSRAASVASSEVPRAQKVVEVDERKEKAEREARAAKAARELSQEREAEAWMSGALPGSEKGYVGSVRESSRMAEGKRSGNGVGGVVEQVRPSPMASERRSQATKTTSVHTLASLRRSDKKSSSGVEQVSLREGMQEVGSATYEPARSQPISRAASVQSKPHSTAAPSAREATPATTVRSRTATPQLSSPSTSAFTDPKPPTPSNSDRTFIRMAHTPTIFAGRGWVSPHPLSQVGSANRSTSIELPEYYTRNGGADTMTYDEYRALREGRTVQQTPRREVRFGRGRRGSEDVHRNFSRTSSDAGSYQGRGWGRRERSGRTVETVETGNYRGATVESVRSGDTEEIGRGVTQLRMPWDEE